MEVMAESFLQYNGKKAINIALEMKEPIDLK